MDAAWAACSSMERQEASARELLLAALEDLSQEQLKRFRHKLRDAPLDGRSIPWGRLECADPLDLVEKLAAFYGPEPALDVTRKILKKADARDVAARLKAQRLQRFGPSSLVLLSFSEYKKKYREHVMRQHAKVKERNARSVKITKRFTKLLIAPGSGAFQEDLAPGPAEEPEPQRARRSDTHTFNRLFRGDEEDPRPLTVVLQGPAGIGKTMAAKKILYDWAAGKLYHGELDFAFFLPCRELLERRAERSLADLILDQCPDRTAPVRQMLSQPHRLLFILDGADELPGPGGPEATPCTDPFEATSGARVLAGLLNQELLPTARLLVTTRTVAPGRLQGRLCSPQCSEVYGFSDKDKKKYFYKFFGDEGRAERAYHFVKENETLFALCFMPFVCSIVCTVLNQQLQLGRDLSRTSKTTTSVYLLYVLGMLKSEGADGPKVQEELRTLCRLARDSILKHQTEFAEKELKGVMDPISQVQSLFLSKKETLGVLEKEVTYQFNQSAQEFLAALSYLLEEDDKTSGASTGDGVQTLLNSDLELRGHPALTSRFLFGLLSAQQIRDVERHFGCVVPERVKQDALRWVQEQGRPLGPLRVVPLQAEETDLEDTEEPEEEEEVEFNFGLELLYCLYETQEDDFVREALGNFPELVLERVRFCHVDLQVLSYCVQCCPDGQALKLVSCRLVAAQEKKKKSLLKQLKGSQSTRKQPRVSLLRPLCEAMTHPQCGLSSLTELSQALKAAPSLKELGLLHCRLTEAGLHALSEGLAWPKCQVQTLRVQLPGLQNALQYLINVLWQSPVLTTLDLSCCQLTDPMVTSLCITLQHPKCSLKTLSLVFVELSEQSLKELQAVKTAKPDLVIIHPELSTNHQSPKESSTVF